mmetsp:Transcript_21370/g.53646  ORF Transcript_21370/g.53646 Transcript_21370/m.53646 type:complete len:431 (+) Transcript_21370:32-1324(+)
MADGEQEEAKAKPQGFEGVAFDDKLRLYYSRLFPYQPMYRWLGYGAAAQGAQAGDGFSRREFSFTLANDIYIRYLSYQDADEWKADMVSKLPHKMDLGAVYTAQPKQKAFVSKEAFKEVEREFVIDIDLTDYQEEKIIVTNCLDPGDESFRSSFRFMVVAVKVLDLALREDFGFDNIFWVFSGRRGVHCWVADERARKMSNQVRSSVAEYLNVFKGGDKDKTKMAAVSGGLHPALRRATREIEEVFEDMVGEQRWMDADRIGMLAAHVPDEKTRDLITERLTRKEWKNRDPLEKWDELKKIVTKASQTGAIKGEEVLTQIMFYLAYPRLDINVSKAMNHLLKAPFVVHPKTQRICVPLDPQRIQDFDPTSVPTLNEILDQLDSSTDKGAKDIDRTALASHVKTFERTFLKALEKRTAAAKFSANQAVAAF